MSTEANTQRTRARSSRSVLAALAAATLIAVPLAGCSLLEGPNPTTPEREVVTEPETPAEFVEGGTAEENLPFFRQELSRYAAGDGLIKGEPIARAIVDAGFDKSQMQVSFDRSKTGLDADNIFVSVLIGEGCLIGQVVAADRSVVAQAVDAVGPETNICLIGETAPINW